MSKKLQLGERIKAYRLENQMTQTRVAAMMGVGRATIARLERGEDCRELTQAKIERFLSRETVAA